jgi:hypothetical protein
LFVRRLIVAVAVLILPGNGANCGVPPGFLEGHLRIVSPRFVEREDSNVPRFTAETYAEYPLVVLSREGKKEITRVTANGNGDFRVALVPGDYVLDVPRRASKHLRAKAQQFTVISNQTVRVDMYVNTGIR